MGNKDVDAICDRYLSRKEERAKVSECVERCLRKGHDYNQLRERIDDCLSDRDKAHRIVNALSSSFSQFRKRGRFTEKDDRRDDRKRERLDDGKDSKSDRRESGTREKENNNGSNAGGVVVDKYEVKRIAEENLARKNKAEVDRKSRPVTEAELQKKEMAYKAQMEVEEAKARLQIKPKVLSTAMKARIAAMTMEKAKVAVLDPAEALSYMSMSLSKKSRMDELKAKLAKNSNIMAKLPQATVEAAAKVAAALGPPAKMVKREPGTATSIVPEKEELIEYLDPRIRAKPAGRSKRAMVFHEKGEFEVIANKQRAKAKLERLQEEISKAAKQTGISSAVKLAMVTPAGTSKVESAPDIEWWDQVVTDADNYDDLPGEADGGRYGDTISELIEHPIKLQPPNESIQPHYLRVYLTKKERKKIRRQNRKEALKEKQEKVRLGLEKAPEPKMKLSNLMRVLGTDAIQDPTKMEAHVRKQMAERQKKHEQENAERKLTKDQKKAKAVKKIAEDITLGAHVAVYRVKSLAHPSKKFKVEMNAKQLQMSGVIILHKDMNVVIVEGGPKQQKFFKHLMLNRIKWDEEIIGEKKAAVDKDQPGERNKCELFWEGIVKKRNFRDLRVHTATIEKQAREMLEKHGVAHYWDLAYSTTILLEGQNTVAV